MYSNKRIIFILGDILLFYGALWIALVERQQHLVDASTWSTHWPPFTMVLVLWLVVFYINGLYNLLIAKNNPILLNRIIVSMLINVVLAAVFFYVTARLWSIRPQTILILTSINFSILFFVWRQIINRVFVSDSFKNTLVFIGYNDSAKELIETINREPQLGFVINALLTTSDNKRDDVPWYDLTEESLHTVLYNHSIDTIIVSSEQYKNARVVSALYKILSPNISIISLPQFYEELTGKVPLNQIERAWALENLTSRKDTLFVITKRLIDLISAVILGCITLLLSPFIVAGILITSGRPLIFTQTRVGIHGKKFKAIKFRSMINDAEKNGATWSQGKTDARITSFGRFMRKTRIDELPQIINILKGELSLVGPRPERPEFVEELIKEIPFYKERLLVKPGVTGWAQVAGPAYGGSKEGSLEKLQYDLFYIKNRSIGLELSVMLKTIKTILAFKGQ